MSQTGLHGFRLRPLICRHFQRHNHVLLQLVHVTNNRSYEFINLILCLKNKGGKIERKLILNCQKACWNIFRECQMILEWSMKVVYHK